MMHHPRGGDGAIILEDVGRRTFFTCAGKGTFAPPRGQMRLGDRKTTRQNRLRPCSNVQFVIRRLSIQQQQSASPSPLHDPTPLASTAPPDLTRENLQMTQRPFHLYSPVCRQWVLRRNQKFLPVACREGFSGPLRQCACRKPQPRLRSSRRQECSR